MKYLKLFEGFSEDFYSDLKSLEDKYESDKVKIRKSYKDKVDQFMFDLTDDYSNQSTYILDFIEEDDPSLWYHLRCEWKDFEKFINILKEVDLRLQHELELKIMLKAYIKGKFTGSHTISHGFSINVEKLCKEHEQHKGRSEEHKKAVNDIYEYVEFKINVLPL
jgi:hypothetical protein